MALTESGAYKEWGHTSYRVQMLAERPSRWEEGATVAEAASPEDLLWESWRADCCCDFGFTHAHSYVQRVL